MALLPSAGSDNTVGVLITTTADDGAITTTQAQLTALGDTAKLSGGAASSAFDNFTSKLKSVGQQMANVGRTLTTTVTLPIVGIAYESTKMAMQFQQDMELLHTNAGVPQSAIKGLSDQILGMAAQVGQGPDALAQAFYHIATAGQGIWTTAQQLNVLKAASEGAAIGQANLDDTTYALTSTLAANVKGAQDYQQTMGTLLGIVQAGDMHLSDLNEVISTGLMGTLSTFGVSLQSAGAALADFGDLGEKGAAAGTRLRMMLTLMTSPSQAASKILGDLGLSTKETATATGTMNDVFAKTGLSTTKLADDLRQPNGISVAITDLKTHLEDAGLSASQTDAILSKAFGGGRTDSALLQLLNTTDRLNLKYQQIGQNAGNFANNWAAQQQTMKQQWDEAWSGIQADMIKLGEAIMPEVSHAMHDVANAVSGLTNWFDHLNAGQKQFTINAFGVAAAVGPILYFFGKTAKSISDILSLGKTISKLKIWGALADGASAFADMLTGTVLPAVAEAGTAILAAMGPVGWVILGVVAGLAALAIIFHSHLGQIVRDIKQWAVDAWQALVWVWQHPGQALRDIGAALLKAFNTVLYDEVGWYIDAGKKIMQWIGEGFSDVKQWGTSIGNALASAFEAVKRNAPQWGRDIVQAIKSGLEALVNWDISQLVDWGKALDKWWQSIDAWFHRVPKRISKDFDEWKKTIEEWIDTVPPDIADRIDKWWQAFDSWFHSVPKKISKDLDAWWQAFKTWVDSIPNKLSTELDSWWQSIKTWIDNEPSNISQELDKWWQALKTWIDGIPGKVTTELRKWKDAITNFITNLPNELQSYLQNLGTQLAEQPTISFEQFWKDTKKIGEIALIVLAALLLIPVLITAALAVQMVIFGAKIMGWILKGIVDMNITVYKWFGGLGGSILNAIGDATQ